MRKALVTTLQVVITLGVLWLVFRDPTKRAEMLATLSKANPWWLIGGVLTYGLVEAIGGYRWLLLLRVQGIIISTGRTFWLVMIGVFFNFSIPGGTGGDVVKAFYLLKETPGQRSLALLSIFVDRLLGLVTLIAVTGGFLFFRWEWLTSTPDAANCAWGALAILAAGAGGLLFALISTSSGLVHKLPARFPGRDRLSEVGLACQIYSRAGKPMVAAIGLSFLSHFGTFFTFYCAAKALTVPGLRLPSLLDLSTILPIVNTLAAMPVSVAGIGVREGLFQIFLGQLLGVRDAVAVLISSTGFLMTVVWGVVGAVLYAFYRPSEHARLREIRKEMMAREHEVAEEGLPPGQRIRFRKGAQPAGKP